MKTRRVAIFGGTGFVGRHLSARLIDCGIEVRVLTRNAQQHRDLKVLPGLRLIEGDPYDAGDRARLVAGCDAVINLVGILNEQGAATFRRAHVELPKGILETCRQQGIRRLLHMSALNADATRAPSQYLRSKGEGENLVHTYGREVAVTSFRPSVIFGPEDSFINRFARLLRLTPGVFPLACPDARFAPVWVGDVSLAFIQALDDPCSHGRRIDLCGPKDYRLREIVDFVARTIGVHRAIVGLPDWAARLQARLLEWAPGKPFTRDNYLSLQVPSVCPPGSERCPNSMEALVPTWLGDRHHEIRLQKLRAMARRP